MGMFDTMNQGNKVLSAVGGAMGGTPNAMGQGFAQQKPPTPSGNGKMQMVGDLNLQPKPMPKPGMGAGYGMQKPVNNWQKPNQMAGVASGIMNAYQASKQKKPIMGGGIPTSGQESLAQPYGKPDVVRPDRPQSGLTSLQTPLDSQRAQERQMSPMQQAAEQMRGYDGPDLGSQDPRELARMNQGPSAMTSLYGSSPLQAQPFGGDESTGFREMEQRAGIGPSNPMQAMGQQVQMDENGLEPRRGAR